MVMSEGLCVDKYVKKYYRDSSHAYAVKKLSLMLFDEVNKTFDDIPLKSRKLLETAAILHDIGYNIESKNHNKHSLTLIIENGLQGFNENETLMIANIARYHRGSLPDKTKHEKYAELNKKERKLVKKLSAILRLCDGLDRAHLELIKSLKANYYEDNGVFEVLLESNILERNPDISSAIRKKDLFEKVFQVQLVFKFI